MEWGDLRVFLQVVRAGHMVAASRSLSLDHSTISRRIARLEEDVGAQLFSRSARKLSLTKEGARVFEAAEKLESIIIREIQSPLEGDQEITGCVRIGTSEGFGAHYLAQRLPRILDAHPELQLDLVALPRAFSLGMREVDLAITMDRPEAGNIRLKKLTSCTLAVYGSREYLRKHGHPRTVDEFNQHAWCGYIDDLLFTDELDMLKFGEVAVSPRYRTTSVTAQLEAIKGGRVIGILPCYMARNHAELDVVLPDTVKLERTYWMSIHGDMANSPKIRAVMAGLEQLVQSDRRMFTAGPLGE